MKFIFYFTAKNAKFPQSYTKIYFKTLRSLRELCALCGSFLRCRNSNCVKHREIIFYRLCHQEVNLWQHWLKNGLKREKSEE